MPPDHPLPADELGLYSPERDFGAEKNIAEYVEGQAPDETVLNVERLKIEYVWGTPYEMWDVTTDKDRWWVITNATNLYSQRHFPSLDYTLSFHVGLMARVMSKQTKDGPSENPFDEVFRRQAQAKDLIDRAVEAVDFQAVGMQLRECLISLMSAVRRRVDLPEDVDRPQDANVIGWGEVLLNHLCGGRSNKELRAHLKSANESTWQLVNWVTHHRNANKTSALIAIDSVDALVTQLAHLMSRERHDRTDECPKCHSRNVRTFYDDAIEPDGAYYEDCGQCEWTSHPAHQPAAA
ncbi:hypothetical protein [Phenylobacterium sp.]|uniref:hypothetical protein n=1 Tax=Phenylobacterium sp. TaxID=1871053 RepID=UPI003001FA8C